MTARPDPTGFALDDFLLRQESRSLLRFVVCGSVDHGKSTFIGRLLYEGGLLFDDQLDALEIDSRRHGTQGDQRDFALVLDGLAAEREQKITIDVAYRFFTTQRRKFIVADVPGHEQYTRNMATGASTADLALLLVSAREGITPQTKRHALIVSTLGVRHIVVAVNKMDLVGWQQAPFTALQAEFRKFAEDLGVNELAFIPIGARSGDNIVTRSDRLPWYRGPALLDYLERVEVASPQQGRAFRLPVQWVNRPDSEFRGYSGLITGGEVHPGMPVQILPSGQCTRVERIVTADGDLDHAFAGQAVTVTLADEVDVSRGEVIAGIGPSAPVTSRLATRLVWMGGEAMVPGRHYVLKLATCSAIARLEPDLRLIDLDTRETLATDRLVTNDIGIGVLQLDRQIAADRYADQKDTGGFILIEPESCDTVAMGIVEGTFQEEPPSSRPKPVIAEVGSIETKARSMAKAIGWRAVGSVGTFAVAGLATGSLKLAANLVLAEILVKIAFNYFHERLWTAISWGRR
jgi:sulfate adenylyltransferase large subunit